MEKLASQQQKPTKKFLMQGNDQNDRGDSKDNKLGLGGKKNDKKGGKGGKQPAKKDGGCSQQ